MARRRMIDPTIFDDPSFNAVSIQARLLFMGLIINADDEGYLRGDAKSLKRLVFGFDDSILSDKVNDYLQELSSNVKNVHVFKVSGEVYVHLKKWDDYQKQRKERIIASIYPKCDKCQTVVRQSADKRQTRVGRSK